MKVDAIRNSVETLFPLRSFLIALSVLIGMILIGLSIVTMMSGKSAPAIETFVPIPEQTVEIESGDLNQLDLKTPEQPRDIEDAIAGLHETTPYGLVPIIRQGDKLTALNAYAASFEKTAESKATISLVMVDFGLSKQTSEDALKALPPGISFVVRPFTKDVQKWTNEARRSGREVWLSLPLQTSSYPAVDTGPNTILTTLNAAENEKRLLANLATSTGYAGVIVEEGNSFSSTKDNLAKLLDSIVSRGLGIVQSDTQSPFLSELIGQKNFPFARNDFWIDEISSEKNMQSQFIEIESTAMQSGSVTVFFRPYPVVLKSLQTWTKDLSDRGIQLAPLSYTVISQ